jgi:hypothetical protein
MVVVKETVSKRHKRVFGRKVLRTTCYNLNLVQILDLYLEITYHCSYSAAHADSKRFPVLSTFSQRSSLKW